MIANLLANLPTGFCLLLGSVLIIAEVFLPGFGLPGISGVVLIGAGVVMTAVHYGLLTGVCVLLVVIAVLAVLVSWVLRSVTNKEGLHARFFLSDKEELHDQKDMQVLVGKRGIATSVLRPAGICVFDGVRLNVVTEGGFIEKGSPVEVVRTDGAKIVVRVLEND